MPDLQVKSVFFNKMAENYDCYRQNYVNCKKCIALEELFHNFELPRLVRLKLDTT